MGALNAGIGGNRMLLDGLGPNAMARFDRDVLSQAGVKYVILLEGVNDLGTLTRDQPVSPEAHAALVAWMIASVRPDDPPARERGLRIYGATVMPYGGSGYYHPDAANEQDRQAINAWIRAPGRFDAVIDFDKLMRDPANPNKLAPPTTSATACIRPRRATRRWPTRCRRSCSRTQVRPLERRPSIEALNPRCHPGRSEA